MKVTESQILKIAAKPVTYPMIERLVARQGNPFALAIAIGRLVLDGKLHISMPDSYATRWPVYCAKHMKKVTHPKRESV